eukprot:156648-Chlamydomonas_euryale.AAC.5
MPRRRSRGRRGRGRGRAKRSSAAARSVPRKRAGAVCGTGAVCGGARDGEALRTDGPRRSREHRPRSEEEVSKRRRILRCPRGAGATKDRGAFLMGAQRVSMFLGGGGAAVVQRVGSGVGPRGAQSVDASPATAVTGDRATPATPAVASRGRWAPPEPPGPRARPAAGQAAVQLDDSCCASAGHASSRQPPPGSTTLSC